MASLIVWLLAHGIERTAGLVGPALLQVNESGPMQGGS